MDQSLPPGWHAASGPDGSGAINTYYWHETTGAVQWELPEAEPEQKRQRLNDSSDSATAAAAASADLASAAVDAARPADTVAGPPERPSTSSSTAASSSAAAAAAPVPLPTAAEIAAWSRKNELNLSESCPPPCITLEHADLPPDLVSAMRSAGFTAPSPIQAAAWPSVASGRDVIGVASTGSGKTLAFLAPHFTRIAADAAGLILPVTTAVVLAPTRELAIQIDKECARFGATLGVASACLYGGAPREPQLAAVEAGVHLIIATPGRLNDYLESGHVRLDDVTYVVLDEADRMLDMGFEPQVPTLLLSNPPPLQP